MGCCTSCRAIAYTCSAEERARQKNALRAGYATLYADGTETSLVRLVAGLQGHHGQVALAECGTRIRAVNDHIKAFRLGARQS
jgi:hypothetical protein